jgi:hypothetical protein
MPDTGFRELGISDAALLSYHSGTTTPCLSLSVPVPLEELNSYRRAVLSPCVPSCRTLSMKENDYEQRRSQVRVLPSAPLKIPQITLYRVFSAQTIASPTVSVLSSP